MSGWIVLITLISAAVMAAALWGAWWLWWRLPKQQVNQLRFKIRDAKARADVEDNLRKSIGQLLGGAVVLLGAGAALVQFLAQQQVSHNALISNQISKGFELLGEESNLTKRLGGIYALEGVMNDSPQYHRAVLEALSAFVRNKTKDEKGSGPPSIDIQAALTVIGRRAVVNEAVPDLSFANIPKANLRDANLNGAKFEGANMSCVNLVNAKLKEANLKDTNLTKAKLLDADLSWANAENAEFAGANINNINFSWASLFRAKLNKVYLTGGENFGHAGLIGDLTGLDLSFSDFRKTEISQEQLDKETCGFNVKLDPPLHLNKGPCPSPNPLLPQYNCD